MQRRLSRRGMPALRVPLSVPRKRRVRRRRAVPLRARLRWHRLCETRLSARLLTSRTVRRGRPLRRRLFEENAGGWIATVVNSYKRRVDLRA